MDESLLQKIRRGVVTSTWLNRKAGEFEYLKDRISYRFIETTEDLYCLIVREQDWDDKNSPIVIKGLLAFLIACWGQDEVAIYNTYNQRKKKQFFDTEATKPGSFKRDLEKEFGYQLLDTEKSNITDFEKRFDYITVEEKNLILDYAKSYLDYTSSIYKQNPKKENKKDIDFKDLLIHNDKEKLLKQLHLILDYTTNKKDFSIVIITLEQLGFLGKYGSRRNLFKVMKREFGDFGTESNFNYYLNPTNRKMILNSEIESVVTTLQKI